MSTDDHDALRRIAERVADCIADTGYAFVEDDKVEGLAATLGSFLTVAGIPVHPRQASGHEDRAAVIDVTAAR